MIGLFFFGTTLTIIGLFIAYYEGFKNDNDK